MKNIIKISLLLITIFSYNILYSQDCSDYYNKCKQPSKTFEKSGMSRGFKISKGDSSEINLNLYANRTYYISVTGDADLGNIQMILISVDGDIIYDNSVDEFKQYLVMTTEIATQLKLQIISQPEVYDNDSKTKFCAGIYVAYTTKN